MRKVALLAATVVVAASTAMATNILDPGPAPASDAACHPGQALDLGCAMRATGADGDGTIFAAELANLAVPAQPAVDWMPLRPPSGTGLDFNDAASGAGSVMPATLDSDRSQRLIPALFALGALVILLRRRPN